MVRRERQRGFTLIELLVVIVILGILAGVVVFAVAGVTDTGRASACKTDRRLLFGAVEAYRAQIGTYPANEADLVPGFLREESEKYDYTAGSPLSTDPGTISPASGSGCT